MVALLLYSFDRQTGSMADTFLSQFQSALDEVTCLFTEGSPTANFNYKGYDYPAIINDIELSNELQEGGLLESLASIIIVSKTYLAIPPKAGETLFIGSKKARIEQVKEDEVSFEIHCRTAVR